MLAGAGFAPCICWYFAPNIAKNAEVCWLNVLGAPRPAWLAAISFKRANVRTTNARIVAKYTMSEQVYPSISMSTLN